MKLLLTNPNFTGAVFIPSLGLGFIGTYVKKNSDCEVEIIEPLLEGLSREQVLEKAKTADFVGLTCYTESRFQTFDFAQRVKQMNASCIVIVGGPHVQSLDKKILEHYPFIDAVVRGEGEETTCEIVKGLPFKDVAGVTWRDGENIVRNSPRPMKENIDEYEYDYSLVYKQIKNWKDLEVPEELQKLNSIPFIGSRGCPFKCSFCAANNQWEKTYRYLSPEEMVKRMAFLVNTYNIRYFRFYDALFIGTDKRIMQFCDLLEQSGLDIHFRIDIRVGTNRAVLERLKKVGCDVVGFGVESGSDRILQRVCKATSRRQIEQTIALCKELHYWSVGFLMVSLPDETLEDIKKTFQLLKCLDVVNVQFFKLHPNTSFYNELKEAGEIDDEVWFYPDRGYETAYGNEIYHSREKFATAFLSRKEAEALIAYSAYYLMWAKPGRTLARRGLFKGTLVVCGAGMYSLLLATGPGRALYNRLKDLPAVNALSSAFRKILK